MRTILPFFRVDVLVCRNRASSLVTTADYNEISHFNPKKSQLGTFAGASPPAAIKLGSTPMDWVEHDKYLGVIPEAIVMKWITANAVAKFQFTQKITF